MTDWEKDLSDFNKEFTDSHESRQPWNRLNQNMQMGRRAAGHNNGDAAPPPSKGGSIMSGLAGLLGIFGLIAGLLLGANFLDMGWIGVVIMLGSAVLGLVIGAAPLLLLQSGIRIIYEKSLWRRQAEQNTADRLVQFWGNNYGAPPLPELLEAMDDNGSAWIMDRKGDFILRMRTGKNLFIGYEEEQAIDVGGGQACRYRRRRLPARQEGAAADQRSQGRSGTWAQRLIKIFACCGDAGNGTLDGDQGRN